MAYDPVPKCPRCGGTDVKLVSQKHRWSENARKSSPVSTLSIYGCPCGTGFTHQVKHELPPAPAKTA
ncbi:MAG TPA: hypothetical protein VFB96_14345 [Pirellulaceae bacterium]|jgi:hypothetical protein|nr:hypothetical protein [Pirellulaceae bacterium]